MPNDTSHWDTAHVLHNKNTQNDPYTAHALHAPLARNNIFTETLQTAPVIRLLHITTSLDTVLDAGNLYTSAGCLVGTVYCVPTQQTADGLRAHNLGAYIYKHEVGMSLRQKGLTHRTISPLIIEATVPATMKRANKGIDYLKLGKVHLKTFHELVQHLQPTRRRELMTQVKRDIAQSNDFWRLCQDVRHEVTSPGSDTASFFEALCRAIPSMPILGYIYFEAIIEYITLHSKDEHTMHTARQDELNCWAYKTFIYRVQPTLLQCFNLADFQPTMSTVRQIAAQMCDEGLLDVDIDAMLDAVKWRVSDLVLDRLLGAASADATFDQTQSFDSLAAHAPDLVGHVIDRSIRRREGYETFCHSFDSHKAAGAWQYWTANNILFPYYGILPKGEVGINPAANVPHRVYLAKARMAGNDLYVEKDTELPLQVIPNLVHAEHALMGLTSKTA